MVQDEQPRPLVYYRKRIRLTQFQVARLLGWKNTKGLGLIELGVVLPTLTTAFKLWSIYRVPIEFLFQKRYEMFRNDIRAKEAALVPAGQQALSLDFGDGRYV